MKTVITIIFFYQKLHLNYVFSVVGVLLKFLTHDFILEVEAGSFASYIILAHEQLFQRQTVRSVFMGFREGTSQVIKLCLTQKRWKILLTKEFVKMGKKDKVDRGEL